MFVDEAATTAALGLGRMAPIPDNGDLEHDGREVETALTYYVAIPLAAVAFVTIVIVLLCMKRERVAVDERRGTFDDERHQTNQVVQRRVNGSFTPDEIQSLAPPAARSTESAEISKTTQHRKPLVMLQTNQEAKPIGKVAPIPLPVARIRPMKEPSGLVSPEQSEHGQGPDFTMLNNTKYGTKPSDYNRGKRSSGPTVPQVPFIVTSLDASPVFQRLKYEISPPRQERVVLGTPSRLVETDTFQIDDRSWKRKSSRPSEVQLNNYRTLRTDFNHGLRSHDPTSVGVARYPRYNTLDPREGRASRRAPRMTEAEKKWAIENHLTDENLTWRHKFSSMRLSKKPALSSVSQSPSFGQSTEDLPKELREGVSTSSGSFRRKPRTVFLPPYKLQVQNSIRPKRVDEYKDGFRRKRPSRILSKSIRRSKRWSRDFELNVVESPSFYMGFDTPLPPPPQIVGVTSSMAQKANGYRKVSTPLAKTDSAMSDHDYEEIKDFELHSSK